MQKKSWSELSPGVKTAIVAGTVVELALTRAAMKDLRRRPKAQVRGKKALWRLACVVQPVGPIAYLAFGRRRSPAEAAA